jgi:hypothetical protein
MPTSKTADLLASLSYNPVPVDNTPPPEGAFVLEPDPNDQFAMLEKRIPLKSHPNEFISVLATVDRHGDLSLTAKIKNARVGGMDVTHDLQLDEVTSTNIHEVEQCYLFLQEQLIAQKS